MDLQILNDRIKELENELKDIRAKLEEAEKEQQKSRRWKPQYAERYCYLNKDGSVGIVYYGNDSFDKKLMAIGNYFATQEETEFEAERLKVLEEMREFEESLDREWNHDNDHYFITWKYTQIYIDSNFDLKHNDIYFESSKKAQECIDKVGADRIKRFYLRVED